MKVFDTQGRLQVIGTTGPAGPNLKPGGRLTLTSLTPVLTGAVLAATTIYYTPYTNDLIPIFDGSVWGTFEPGELSLGLDATNTVTAKNYDIFVFNDAGTIRIGYGPAWSTDTTRGAGAGTTELQRMNGVWTNRNSITLRYSAVATVVVPGNKATFLGSFRSTAAGQTAMDLGTTSSSGGTNKVLGVSNAYNRVEVSALNIDSQAPFTYALLTWRPLGNSVGNRFSYIDCLGESIFDVRGQNTVDINGGSNPSLGFNVDSTTATPAIFVQPFFNTAVAFRHVLVYQQIFLPALGFHFIQAMEADGNTTAYTANFGSAGIMARCSL